MAYAVAQGPKLIPSLAAKPWGVNPLHVPDFLAPQRRVRHDARRGQICRFHAAIPNPAFRGATQTVAVASYPDATSAAHESDTAVLSHEIGEWVNDPLGTNATPPWGNVGQVNGHCHANLEIGGPLTGTTFPVACDDVTDHPELAWFSWFYEPIATTGVNGSFSFNGTFTRPAPRCPPGGQYSHTEPARLIVQCNDLSTAKRLAEHERPQLPVCRRLVGNHAERTRWRECGTGRTWR